MASVGSWRRWAIVLLVLAVAVPAAIVGKGGEAGPVDERDTSCWPCHVGWSPPLKTFFDIIPPAEAGAAVDQEFEYVVRLQGVWAPPGDGPYLRFVAPTLDLGAAPSLTFAGGPEPIVGLELPGAVNLQPAGPGTPVGRASVVQEIPIGMTVVDVTLQPTDPGPTGPTFTMKVYTGGAEKFSARAAGPGQPVQKSFGGDELALLGFGNWTVEAVADDLQSFGVPRGVGGQGFAVIITARAETSGVTALQLPLNTNVPKGASYLFTYGLKATGQPGPDEAIGLVVNVTEYYQHKDKGTDDYANVTKAYGPPLKVQAAPDGRIIIVGPQDSVSGVPQPFNGWSIDTLSEAIGYMTAFLLLSSIWTGGMFGKGSRRQLNTVFGSAKRRVAFHNFLSYGIILAATVHTVLFIVETAYYWTLGVLWGGLAILAMFGLGITGAWQVGMIRRWNYAIWRWTHFGLSLAAILFTLVHMGLDGVHFGFIQEPLGWNDPLDPRSGVQ